MLGGAALLRPRAACAQPSSKLPIVGVLGLATPEIWRPWIAAFLQRLGERGWIDGRTVAIEYRWTQGSSEHLPEIAAEFVRLNPAVIVTTAPAVAALKQLTSTIPIVFALANDPVGGGMVASLARPGGNITGLSIQATDLASKRVELLHDVLPRTTRVALLGNVSLPQAALEVGAVTAAARMIGIETLPIEMLRVEDIAAAFATIKGRVDAIYVFTEPLTNVNRVQINSLALSAGLPSVYGSREYVEAGGLLSYGPNFPELFRRTADVVDKILRGVKPADIPVEQPTAFDFALNLKTAMALGVTIPPRVLALADRVIE